MGRGCPYINGSEAARRAAAARQWNEGIAMKRSAVAAVMLLTLTLAGCSGMNNTQQKMLSGGAIGAAGGAVVTALTGGCIWCGAAIGGAVGTGAGYVIAQTQH
jgi:osmotically inducible lipoprotein OsmB